MTFPRLLLFASTLALLSACAVQRKPPPVPAPRPVPVAIAPAPPPPADWRDAPITAGTWVYGATVAGAIAAFSPGTGEPLLTLACQRGVGELALSRAGAATGAVPLTVTTTTLVRAFSAAPDAAGAQRLTVSLPARDPLLDAIAFSRGRFMVETPGLPTLYLPAWPELGRVIEDCR
jgi:hypothetical protein